MKMENTSDLASQRKPGLKRGFATEICAKSFISPGAAEIRIFS
jgi:hypothetical protein